MRYSLTSMLLLAGLLGGGAPFASRGQVPRAFFVSSPCPASANNPSVLRRLETNGSFTTVGTVNAGGTGLTINGLGFNSADPTSVYGMTAATGTTIAALQTPPTLYKVALTSGAATAVGPVSLPPAPAGDIRIVLSLLGDGGPNSHYYIGGVTVSTNIFTPGNIKFYLGDIDLAAPTYTGPVWRLTDISDPTASAVIQAYFSKIVTAYLSGTPPPDGGIQDWAYDPLTDRLVSLLGVEQKFLTVSNLTTSPVAVMTTPSVPIPIGANVGYMYRDNQNNLFGMTSDNGIIYALDRLTGSYLGTSQNSGLGCTLGDATIGPLIQPLPVTLVAFEVTARAGAVSLTWTTASEIDADRFEVQRQSGEGPWETVGTTPATNPRGGKYTFRDATARPGQYYYRLAMVDRDGSRAYSPVRAVQVASGPVAPTVAYPNPTRDRLTVALGTEPPAGSRVELRDALGRVQLQAPLAQKQTHDLTGLSPGVYVLRTNIGGKLASQRVVVTK